MADSRATQVRGPGSVVQDKYGVRLPAGEVARVRRLVKSGRSSARASTRACSLLKLAGDWTARQAEAAPN